jgi:hypothetical protein
MVKNSVLGLAVVVLALALGACQRQAAGDAAGRDPILADDPASSPAAAAQTQLQAAFLGKSTPPYPDGFTEEGGHIEEASGGEISVVYGRWTHAGGDERVMFVQRATGTQPADAQGRLPAEIVSVFAMPAPRANEILFTEYCTHPDYPETAARIYANAGTTQRRPGMSDPPSAAWRLDRSSARLLPVDASRVTCAFDHME